MDDPRGLADHSTPFVRGEWYVAALSSEVGRNLLSRQILGIGILLYRRENGVVVSLRNRCPHRSYPLSRGKLVGDGVTCGYHGLSFGPDGHCTEVPSQVTVPDGLATPSYPTVERDPFVWIWMGESTDADMALLPDHHWLGSPDFASYTGYIHCQTNYIRLHENVLDLTHFPYVHGEATGGLDYIRAPFAVEVHHNSVVITRRLENAIVNPGYARSIGNAGHRCNRTSESWFKSPAFHIAHATIEDLDGGVDGRTDFHFKIIHCFTPETQHTSHYFYANARDAAIDDEALTAQSEQMTRSTFLEDEEALKLVEQTWLREDVADFKEFSVRGDLAGLHMRRIIARRAMEEATSLRAF